MPPLVRLRARPSRDGKTFKYFLDFKDATGKRRQVSLQQKLSRSQLEVRGLLLIESYALLSRLATTGSCNLASSIHNC
jgi:hypothetical protein